MLTPIYLFLVTGITAGEAPTHWFLSIDGEWQERVAGLFGNALPEKNLFSNRSTPELMQNRHPLGLVNPEGDGACLPRALSLAIWGTQDNHQLLRDAVVDRMLEGPLPGDSRPWGEVSSADGANAQLQRIYGYGRDWGICLSSSNTHIFMCKGRMCKRK